MAREKLLQKLGTKFAKILVQLLRPCNWPKIYSIHYQPIHLLNFPELDITAVVVASTAVLNSDQTYKLWAKEITMVDCCNTNP